MGRAVATLGLWRFRRVSICQNTFCGYPFAPRFDHGRRGNRPYQARAARHWAAVDAELPREYPLVLLSGVTREKFDGLAKRLRSLQEAVDGMELEITLARVGYEGHKRKVHEWLRAINVWMRGNYRGTDWFAVVQRVPGRGQSYQHWWDATERTLRMWRRIVTNPLPPLPGPWEYPLTLENGGTVEEFEAVVKAFKAAYRATVSPETDLKMARGALRRAQQEAADLLMAYGHGVRARLGQSGALMRAIPQLWPRHGARATPPAPPLRESRG